MTDHDDKQDEDQEQFDLNELVKELNDAFKAIFEAAGEEAPKPDDDAMRKLLGEILSKYSGHSGILGEDEDDDDPFEMSALHAPEHGIVITGKYFKGGQFIPAEYVARLDQNLRKELIAPEKAQKLRAKRVPERKYSAKGQKALAKHAKTDKEKQGHARMREIWLAHKLGATWLKDHEAMDQVLRHLGKEYGIETKTFCQNSQNEIVMNAGARARKQKWKAGGKGRTIHTVLIDDRDIWEGGRWKHLWSGHKILYRRGCASYPQGTMHPVKNIRELVSLILSPDEKLPEKARA